MDRSIGFEKKIQPKQFEPFMATTFVNNIPLEFWSNQDALENLYKLLVVQTYKILAYAYKVEKELNQSESGADFLNQLEQDLAENLDLSNITININLVKE